MGARKAAGESGELGEKTSTVDGRITVDGKELDSPGGKTVEGNEFALVNVGKEQNSKKGRSSALFFETFGIFWQRAGAGAEAEAEARSRVVVVVVVVESSGWLCPWLWAPSCGDTSPGG